jgi:hypothetical protein
MIWLDSHCEHCPSLLLALGFEKLLATLFELTGENGLSSLWAPDEMVDHQVDSVLISCILVVSMYGLYTGHNQNARVLEPNSSRFSTIGKRGWLRPWLKPRRLSTRG